MANLQQMKYTAPQQRKFSNKTTATNPFVKEARRITQAMKHGLPEGNVELAAVMGHAPSQIALGRSISPGMKRSDLFKFLLSDPHLRVTLGIDQ